MRDRLLSAFGVVYPYISPIIVPFIQSRAARRTLATVSTIYALYIVYSLAKKYEKRRKFDKKRQKRQQEAKEALQRLENRVKGVKDKPITDLSLFQVKEKLSKGELKAIDLLEAFWAKALRVHNLTNCLVEPVFEAEEAARDFDNGKKDGLLAGIPVSIKDDVGIKNYTSTTGATVRADQFATEDSALVKTLRKHGAVIYVKTNEPQLGLSVEPGNPIYGTVRNPHNLQRNPGASSSGEGALVGGGGSLLGFGSDIGGSIRIPANNCGCCGFKPTSQRVSHLGMEILLLEESAIPVTWGPLARDVDSIVLAMQALWDGSMTEFDALSVPMKFQKEIYEDKKPMKIGYFYYDCHFNPTPVACRAIDMAVQELKRQGHTVVEWRPPGIESAMELEFEVLMQDGGEEVLEVLDGDKVDKTIEPIIATVRKPWIVKMIMPYIAKLFGSKQDAAFAEAFKGKRTPRDVLIMNQRVQQFTYKVIEEWEREGLDAVICPPAPYPPLPLGKSALSMRGDSTMMMFNVLNFPSGIVRMTKQTKQDIGALKNYRVKDKFHAEVKELSESGEGLPAGVMVSTLRWQDEKCLRVMKAVEKAADFAVI